MDQVSLEAIKTAAMVLGGFMWQWMRSPQKIPNWLSWVMFGAGTAGLYFWQTPNIMQSDWRMSVLGVYAFIMAVRGQASTFGDMKLAPKTDSI